MKKIISLICVTIVFWADPAGNPAFPRLLEKGFQVPEDCSLQIRSGYEGNFLLNGAISGSTDEYSAVGNAGTLTLSFQKLIEAYTSLGALRTKLQWRFITPLEEVFNVKSETTSGFYWALGLRTILYERGAWTLGAEGRYSKNKSSLEWLNIDGVSNPKNGATFEQDVGQVNLGISYKIDLFTPYVSLNYLHLRSKIQNPSVVLASDRERQKDFKNNLPVGMNLGCTLSSGSYFFLNVEARVINEEAVTVSGEIQF